MMSTEDARNVEFYDKIKFLIFDESSLLFYTKLVTMLGHLNIKYCNSCFLFSKEVIDRSRDNVVIS
jgi:hypothetical protein